MARLMYTVTYQVRMFDNATYDPPLAQCEHKITTTPHSYYRQTAPCITHAHPTSYNLCNCSIIIVRHDIDTHDEMCHMFVMSS